MKAGIMDKLLTPELMARWSKPLTADELLEIAGTELEPLFREPPVGPVPDYLEHHFSVYGCVSEYEERIEELVRWKALELCRWLKAHVGKIWHVSGKAYKLEAEGSDATFERFWLELIGEHQEGMLPMRIYD